MKHNRFGRTEMQIPAITFGGGWVGGVLIHGSEDQANAALDMAWGAGIDWIDTAASYGDGVSETVIGRWLTGRAAAERPRISTKFAVEPGTGDMEGQMRRSIEASFGRLGVRRVEVITLHNQIGAGHGFSPADALAMADAMDGLRADGLCDHIGLTALGEPAAVAETVGAGRFDVAQVYYNMLNPTAWRGRARWNSTDFDGLLQVCREHDMGVMGIRIFAAGHLATNERHGREIPITDASGDAAEEARAAEIWARLGEADDAPAQAALRFGLACPELSTIVVGLGEIEHLRLAIAAAEMGPLSEERLAAIAGAWEGLAFTG